MSKSKTRLVADFLGKIKADPVTGKAVSSAEEYTDQVISELVGDTPTTLDTLEELSTKKVDKINITGDTVGSASQVPVITFNEQGQITSATETAVAGVSSTSYNATTGVITINTSDGGSHTADLGVGTADSPTFADVTLGTSTSTVSETFDDKVDKINVTGATVGSASQVPVITYNAQGQITSATTTNVAGVSSFSYDSTTEQLTITTADGGSYSVDVSSLASESFVNGVVANLVDSAPVTLDTLNELAAALGDDPNFATTVSNSIGTKAAKTTTVSAGTALTGGGDLSTNRTISHASVSRSNTTDTGSLAHSGTFTAITDVTTNTQGHVTGAKTTTYTLPAGYSHPSYAGDDINLDTGPLSGATVISDLDFNVTTDTLGHVTDANATYSTRTLTAADIGAQPAGNYVLRTGDTMTGTLTVPNLTIGSGNKIKFANNDYIRYDDANGVGRWHFDSDGGTNNSSVQAATFVGALSGNASTSSKWATARTNTVTLTGDATGSGSASVDGSGNWTVSVPVTVINDSHTHDTRYQRSNGLHKRFSLNNSGVGERYYKIGTHSGGNGFVQMIGTIGSHVESFNTSRFSLTMFVREDNQNGEVSVDGTFEVANDGSGVRIIRTTDDGVYEDYEIWLKVPNYAQVVVDIDHIGLSYDGATYVTNEPTGFATEIDTSSYTEGHYAVTTSSVNKVFHDGYHPNADKWTTARTLSLTGDVTGSVSWDGSGNASLSTTVANDSHNHDGRYYTETEADGRFVNVTGDTMTGKLVVDVDNVSDGAVKILANQTNPNNDFYFAQEITSTLSGTTVTTADREQGGIWLDINSTATGGDTSNEHRVYGIFADVDSTGDADVVVGVYGNATATPSTGQTSEIYGGHFYAEDNGGAGAVSNVYGVYGYALADNTTADTNSLIAGRFVTAMSSDAALTSTAAGVYGEVQIDGTTDKVGTTYVFQAEYDNNTAIAQTHTSALFYGNYAGTLPTTAYGVYIPDNVNNVFGGTVTANVEVATPLVDCTSIQIGSTVTLSESTDRADLLQITSTTSGWGGLQIRNSSNEGRWSFMTDGEYAGIYNDEDNQWHIYMQEGGYTQLRYASSTKLQTSSSGVTVTGSMTASGNVTAYSDKKLKENIEVIPDALAKVSSLSGYTFDRVDMDVPRQTGVIAQEVQAVLPEAVTMDESGTLGVSYGNMVGLLIEAIKELTKRVKELEGR